jgi:hypothetical protein
MSSLPPLLQQDPRWRRRQAARDRLRRRRRRALLAVVGAVVLATGAGVAALGGGGGATAEPAAEPDAGTSAEAAPSPPPAPPPELPRGGRSLFPEYRVVAFYGAPGADELGELGIGSPDEAARKLARQAKPYRFKTRPVMPAFELIATVVTASGGDDGKHRFRQKPEVIRRYLRAARRHKALLILDIQPGRANFMDEVRHFRRWLREPDVSLALDPEWSMREGQVPGRQIGYTNAETVNRVSSYLSGIVERHRLPEKLLVVHQFTEDMIRDKSRLRRHPGVALTLNVDGFGGQEIKKEKYREFTEGERRWHHGFKLFYHEDTNVMSPRQVLALQPRPDFVVYE